MDVGSSLPEAIAKKIWLIESGPVLSNYACQAMVFANNPAQH